MKEEINNSIYKYKYTKGTRFGIGIYFKNTPGNLGSVSEWATYCSNPNNDLCEDNEPSFYFGSGTKPLTSMMVVSEIYKVWKKQNPNGTNKEFLNFYAGPDKFQHILQNLSIYNVSMMRSGIPDSDSIWGIDTSAQLASRTHSIGPIQFVSEIIGFDWDPLWSKKNKVENFKNNNSNYTPNSKAVSGYLGYGAQGNRINYPLYSQLKESKYPSAQYSSSAYTFLGILLWLLYDSKGEKNE